MKLSRRTQSDKVRIGPVEGGRGPGPAKTAWGQHLVGYLANPSLQGKALPIRTFALHPAPGAVAGLGHAEVIGGAGPAKIRLGTSPW